MNTLFQNYALEFRLIFFPVNSFAPPFTGSSLPSWIQDGINPAFNSQFPCIKEDCIIVLTTSFSTGGGHGSNNVALISGVGLPKTLIAHELGHNLGLQHPGSCHDCSMFPTFMCQTPGTINFNPCDDTQLANFNTGVFTTGVSCGNLCHCAKWADITPVFPEDFDCSAVSWVEMLSDQPYLVRSCTPDRSKAMFTITVSGGASGITNGKIGVRYQESRYNWDANAPGQDFNQSVAINQDFNELRMVEPNTSTQLVFDLEPDEVRTFHFILEFNPSVTTNPPGDYQLLWVEARFTCTENNVSQLKTSIVKPKEMTPVSGTVTNLGSGNPILLTGNVTIASDVAFNTPYILANSGTIIVVENQAKVKPSGFNKTTTIEGCTSMWEGIKLVDGASLELSNVTIKDAQRAVDARQGTHLVAKNCRFLNNNIAIAADNKASGNLMLLSNEYGTTDAGLKSSFVGQKPLPDGKGFAAVYLKNAGAVEIDSDPGSGDPNQFYNLKFGVLSYNTEVGVHNGLFQNITQVPLHPNYAILTTVPTGKAIYQEKGSGYLIGGANPTFTFQNCHTGIEAFGGNTFVLNATMNEVNNGIVATNNKLITCADNHIVAAEKGIDIRHLVPFLPPQTSTVPLDFGLYSNDIEISDHALGVGININGIYKTQGASSLQNPAFDGGILSSNSVTMSTGATGIYLNSAAGTKAYRNTIALGSTQNNRYGIYLAGGENNKLSCNDVSGTGSGDAAGLYAIHPSKAGILCNNAEDLARGLHIEGVLVGKENAVVAGNSLIDNSTGLLYGVDAITGEQKHRGNRWQGSSTVAQHNGGVNVADASKYTVDAAENPDYLPDSWAPLAWFTDEDAEQDSTYQCPSPGFCTAENPVTAFSGGEDLDIRIAKEELPGEAYQAANNWLAQRRLYERLDEEGNPYPNDTDVTDFLTTAQTNGIAAYANLQAGIRQVFAIDETDRDSFELYERRIVGGLEDLAGLAQQLYTPDISTQDSSSLASQLAAARQTIQTAAAAKASLLDLIDSLRAVAAGALWTQNSSLPDLE
ncbi:MAG: hypothetical protein IT260_11290, partial [Saprospiraceae bacterium]|nr:hypothetical protein [Saprospiraceae bacterium]